MNLTDIVKSSVGKLVGYTLIGGSLAMLGSMINDIKQAERNYEHSQEKAIIEYKPNEDIKQSERNHEQSQIKLTKVDQPDQVIKTKDIPLPENNIDENCDGQISEDEALKFCAKYNYTMSENNIEKVLKTQFIQGADYWIMDLSPLQNPAKRHKISMGPGSVDEIFDLGIQKEYLGAFQKPTSELSEEEALEGVEGAQIIEDNYKIGYSVIRRGKHYNIIMVDKKDHAKTYSFLRKLDSFRRAAEKYDTNNDGVFADSEAAQMLKEVDGADGSIPDNKIKVFEIEVSLSR